MNTPAQTVSDLASLDEAGLKRWVRKAIDRLAELDCIGGAQDFLSDERFRLETEDSARRDDETWARIEEGRA